MPHVDPTHLVELALGNDFSHDDVGALRHIAVCRRCWEELSLMTRVVSAARGVEEPDLPAAPPERVWRGITRERAETEAASGPAPSISGLCGSSAGSPRMGRFPRFRSREIVLALAAAGGLCLLSWWHRARSGRRCDRAAFSRPHPRR